jgi:substrate import-associated zinc metallohydrolase lipoprotein
LHHEFQHILNQKKPYDTTFDLISEGDYVSGDWYQYDTYKEALPKGFIRNYAMVEPREDYAELYSQYLTNNDALWASKMEAAGKEGQDIINAKLAHIRNYMRENWNIDLEEMRACVQRRASEYMKLDFEHLN